MHITRKNGPTTRSRQKNGPTTRSRKKNGPQNLLYSQNPKAPQQTPGGNGCGIFLIEFLLYDAQGKETTASGGDDQRLLLAVSYLTENFEHMEGSSTLAVVADIAKVKEVWCYPKSKIPERFPSGTKPLVRGRFTFTPSSLWNLQPVSPKHTGFLSDFEIMWGFTMLREKFPRIFYVDTYFVYFLGILLDGKLNFEKGARFFKEFNRKQCNTIIVPVNVDSQHWYAFKVLLDQGVTPGDKQNFSIELVDGLPKMKVTPPRNTIAKDIKVFFEWLLADPQSQVTKQKRKKFEPFTTQRLIQQGQLVPYNCSSSSNGQS